MGDEGFFERKNDANRPRMLDPDEVVERMDGAVDEWMDGGEDELIDGMVDELMAV